MAFSNSLSLSALIAWNHIFLCHNKKNRNIFCSMTRKYLYEQYGYDIRFGFCRLKYTCLVILSILADNKKATSEY